MLDTESWERIARYALGECSAAEAVATRAWIDVDPDRKAVAEELSRLADAGPAAIWNAREAWLRFSESVGAAPTTSPGAVLPSSQPSAAGARGRRFATSRAGTASGRRVPRLLAAAAAIVLVASSAALWQATRGPAQGGVATEDLRSIQTLPRQTANVYLSDGTHVVLAPASTLRFPPRFRGTRDVFLEGEAYFDVAPEKRRFWRPRRDFTVHTDGAVARDLGTRFSVRAYAQAAATEVLVEDGAVALIPADVAGPERPVADSLVLGRADLGRVDTSGGLSVVRGVDVDAYHGWMRGRLVFTDAPVGDVLAQFRRWFDVDVQIGDSALANARLTATFAIDSPAQALDLLAVVLNARVEREAGTGTAVLVQDHRGR